MKGYFRLLRLAQNIVCVVEMFRFFKNAFLAMNVLLRLFS